MASLAAGAGHLRIVWRHLLANAAGAIRTAAVMAVGRAILVESALSFFGVGVQPPEASWGSMLYQAQAAMSTEPWLALFPGACIVVTVGALTAASGRARERRRRFCPHGGPGVHGTTPSCGLHMPSLSICLHHGWIAVASAQIAPPVPRERASHTPFVRNICKEVGRWVVRHSPPPRWAWP